MDSSAPLYVLNVSVIEEFLLGLVVGPCERCESPVLQMQGDMEKSRLPGRHCC